MNHGPVCRKQMESYAPEYGSECTCGLEALVEIIDHEIDNLDVAVPLAEYLNGVIYWRAIDEGRDPFACWCGKDDDD